VTGVQRALLGGERASAGALLRVARLLGTLAAIGGCSPARLEAVDLAPSTLSRYLLAHWAFDDGSGTVARDDSGYQRPAQLTGGSWLEDGRFGGAVHFDEGEFASVPQFPPATSSFTVSAWVRLAQYTQTPATGAEWATVVSTEDSGGWEVNIDHSNPRPAVNFGFWKGPDQGDYEGDTCTGVQLNTWTQVAGVVDLSTSTFSVFLDGKLCFSATSENVILPGSPTLTIGAWPLNGRYLVGDVDDIAVWGRALVPEEIALLTEAPPSIAP
jgi:hypothetical protein